MLWTHRRVVCAHLVLMGGLHSKFLCTSNYVKRKHPARLGEAEEDEDASRVLGKGGNPNKQTRKAIPFQNVILL